MDFWGLGNLHDCALSSTIGRALALAAQGSLPFSAPLGNSISTTLLQLEALRALRFGRCMNLVQYVGIAAAMSRLKNCEFEIFGVLSGPRSLVRGSCLFFMSTLLRLALLLTCPSPDGFIARNRVGLWFDRRINCSKLLRVLFSSDPCYFGGLRALCGAPLARHVELRCRMSLASYQRLLSLSTVGVQPSLGRALLGLSSSPAKFL